MGDKLQGLGHMQIKQSHAKTSRIQPFHVILSCATLVFYIQVCNRLAKEMLHLIYSKSIRLCAHIITCRHALNVLSLEDYVGLLLL